MPLKPGQKKAIDIKVKVQKIKGLQDALKKANEYQAAMDRYSYATPAMTKSIKEKVDALRKEIEREYNILKSEIATLKQQHAKANKGGTSAKVDEFVKKLAKECSQIIPLYRKTNRVLLRGTKSGPQVYIGRSWANRKTKDSKQGLQTSFDIYLKSKGFKSLRSNSIFTTTDMDQADGYGDVYYIYPKNGFAYHWYEEQTDLVLDDPSQVYSIDKMETIIDSASDWYEKKYKKETPDRLYQFEEYDKPEKLIAMLQKVGYPKAKGLTAASFIDGAGIRLEIAPTQKNLPQALERGGEVCITGEYYAIEVGSSIASYLHKKLKIETEWDNEDMGHGGNPVDDADDEYF